MALITKLKDPSNGIRGNAYLKKHAFKIETNNTGVIEMEGWQDQATKESKTAQRMGKLLQIKIGDKEIVNKTEAVDEKTGVATTIDHAIIQIAYADIQVEYDALWAKIYAILKNKKINYADIETDLSLAIDA